MLCRICVRGMYLEWRLMFEVVLDLGGERQASLLSPSRLHNMASKRPVELHFDCQRQSDKRESDYISHEQSSSHGDHFTHAICAQDASMSVRLASWARRMRLIVIQLLAGPRRNGESSGHTGNGSELYVCTMSDCFTDHSDPSNMNVEGIGANNRQITGTRDPDHVQRSPTSVSYPHEDEGGVRATPIRQQAARR